MTRNCFVPVALRPMLAYVLAGSAVALAPCAALANGMGGSMPAQQPKKSGDGCGNCGGGKHDHSGTTSEERQRARDKAATEADRGMDDSGSGGVIHGPRPSEDQTSAISQVAATQQANGQTSDQDTGTYSLGQSAVDLMRGVVAKATPQSAVDRRVGKGILDFGLTAVGDAENSNSEKRPGGGKTPALEATQNTPGAGDSAENILILHGLTEAAVQGKISSPWGGTYTGGEFVDTVVGSKDHGSAEGTSGTSSSGKPATPAPVKQADAGPSSPGAGSPSPAPSPGAESAIPDPEAQKLVDEARAKEQQAVAAKMAEDADAKLRAQEAAARMALETAANVPPPSAATESGQSASASPSPAPAADSPPPPAPDKTIIDGYKNKQEQLKDLLDE